MKIKSFLFIIVINMVCLKTFSQAVSNESQLDVITNNTTTYAEIEGREKTYLHTDRDSYCPGDTLWFKSYLVDGITHKKSDKSRVVYVELLDSKDSILSKRMLYAKETSSYGNIELPPTMMRGDYKLRAFTRFMLNDLKTPFYQKSVSITCNEQVSLQKKIDNANSIGTSINSGNWSTKPLSDDLALEFFPEGGSLVYGLSSLLTIKTVDYNGLPIAVKGTINDVNDKIIASIETDNFGYGSTYFTPSMGNSYHVMIHDKGFRKKFAITSIKNQGYSLSIKNRGEDIIIQLEASTENSLHNTLLVGYLKGEKILESLGESSNSKSYGVKLVTKSLPDGVANFVLYDPDGEIICNRQVFVNSSLNDAIVAIESNTKSLKTREKVQLSIAVSDANGKPIKGDFSMRVIPTNGITKKAQMKNWMLLESDFCGLSSNSNTFFNNDSKESKLLLDALLQASEWRHSFENKANSQTKAHFHKPEKGIMISGEVKDVALRSSSKKNMIVLNNLSDGFSEEKELDENGRFSFGPYLFNDSTAAFLELVTKRKRIIRQRGEIIIDTNWPKVPATSNYNTCTLIKMPDPEIYESKIPDFEPIYTIANDTKITYLKEVVVKKKKKSKKQLLMDEINSIALYGGGDERIFRDSIKGWEGLSAMDLLARRGFRVTGSYPFQKATVLAGAPNSYNLQNGPLIIVDGVVAQGVLNQLRAHEILFIDVLKFGSATLFGSRGANGVIIAYTHRVLKHGNYQKDPDAGYLTVTTPGFSKNQEFYLPNYAVSNEANSAKDYRATLYWNPTIKINNEGRSIVEFYTNDRTGHYTVELEGVTEHGEVLYSSYDIEVHE